VCFLFVGGLRENIEVYICRDARSKASSPQSKHTMYGGMGSPTSLARDGGTAGRRDGTKIKQLALTSVSVAGMKRLEVSQSPLDGMLVTIAGLPPAFLLGFCNSQLVGKQHAI